MPCVTTLKPWQRRATALHFPGIPYLASSGRRRRVAEGSTRASKTGTPDRTSRRVTSLTRWQRLCTAKPIFPTRRCDRDVVLIFPPTL